MAIDRLILLGDDPPRPRSRARQRALLENNDWVDQGRAWFLDPNTIEDEHGFPYIVNGNILWLRLVGNVASKKNEYTVRRNKVKGDGTRALAIKEDARADLQGIAFQVPGALRDLRLRHPDVEVWTFIPLKGCDADRDNKWVALSDILVKYGVLANDSIRHFNGNLQIHPAILWDVSITVVKLTAKEEIRIR